MPTIEAARLMSDLRTLAEFGRYKTGVHRPTYSKIDMEARHWLMHRMTEAGLDPVIDGIGTVIGRSKRPGPRLLVGSHVETQPHAGWLDGAMGVMYGVELARIADFAVDVGAWADEEGHYLSLLGSRSFCGEVSEETIDKTRNRVDGRPLREALAEAGLAGKAREHLDPKRYVGYLEAHVEQGDYLDNGKLRLGIVTGIVGIQLYQITFLGQQNHAGTTRMAVRRDAGVALMRLCAMIEKRFPEVAGPRSVWTTGKISLDPGAPSVIPGRAEMLFQFRDVEPAILERMEKALDEMIAEMNEQGPCKVELEVVSKTLPHAMDTRFQDAIEQAAEARAPKLHMRLPSAAGHDAQTFARHIRAGMLFVPSIAGISHHYAEDTREEDIVLGCQVFADAAERILRAA
ncbi:MAG TPA: Zn-dependent hydrolase [Stellaceae bacterium]|nr:Zn-dependent hydrolase [Stellaceae bacterium]